MRLRRLVGPDLDLAAEANARGCGARSFARRDDVVAAELVGGFEGLLEGEGRLGGAVDVEGGGAAGGEDCVWGGREGEYFGWVGWRGVLACDQLH